MIWHYEALAEGIRGSQMLLGLHRVKHRAAMDDASAFLYYGTFGALDPKAPFIDAPGVAKATGKTYLRSLAMVTGIGFLTLGALGFVLDPHDKRHGGVWESPIFQSAWEPITEGWEMGRESDSPWWL